MGLPIKLFEKLKPTETHRTTQDEQIKITFVKERFNDMNAKRSAVESSWDIYQTMFEAIFTPYPDQRSSSTVPFISSMVELYVAEAIKLKTQYNFKAETSKFNTQAEALEYVWKYAWRK